MKSFIRNLCAVLGWFELVLGFIGSCGLAGTFGVQIKGTYYPHTERDWALTVLIFVSCFFSVLIVFSILLGITMILDQLENMEKQLEVVRNGLARDFTNVIGTLKDNKIQEVKKTSQWDDDLPEI